MTMHSVTDGLTDRLRDNTIMRMVENVACSTIG